MSSLDELQERLAYRFREPELLLRALTHTSFFNERPAEAGGDNQRLEFLGDAVLNLAIGQVLMERFPEAPEGELSRLRSRVVSEGTLARAAGELGLGDFLRIGRGEELTGGRRKASLLGDACEAVIGAAYLDGGFERARALCERILAGALVGIGREDDAWDRDFKTRLQEMCQARGGERPRYAVVAEQGPDHDKEFEVALIVGGQEVGRGRGRSKRDAEQDAARAALDAMKAGAP